MNSNGQTPFSVDGSPVRQTQPPAPPQQPSVDTNTDTRTGNTQNQHPSTSHDCQIRTRTRTQTQTQTQTQTRVKTRSWFPSLKEKTSSGDNLHKLSETLLVTNFSAAIAMVIFRSEGSPLQYALNSKPPHGLSFGILVACIAIGFTCNMQVILLQKKSPIVASIGEYAGVFSSVIGFLAMIQMILPLTLWWIVWPAGISIFLSSLYALRKNRDDTEDENAMFYWGGEIMSDHKSVSYNGHVKKFCKVKKGTTLHELEAMIMPKVGPIGENVQLKFKCRFPSWESINKVEYALVSIDNDEDLAFVLNQPKNPWSKYSLQFYVDWDKSMMANITPFV
ncbi:hypothetical protein CsSME_00018984 [Camellia sinensis var. sinensis]|uniref:Uncharacterized protein n=1 Tax=Camellia sinensis var. sinensis TaxID=542762 RepID=A0A4S4D9S6_CAMSN|nr:uncharacterized protein LOC114313143 [Camellia sinensis]XP_028115311.1 uncharacterized protein LOC114313143 [Camellia sinensis]XP_028115312.1 uncharacterized protein LOC114313143 [Camellia sinensis]THF99268.1 hypothetical protein TEA_017105 [Camellia sinensis var. sinensis]